MLNLSNIYDTLAACDHLLMSEGKNCCARYLNTILKSSQKSVTLDQVLKVRRSAELYSLQNVRTEADQVRLFS